MSKRLLPSEALAEQVRRLRLRHEWSQDDLARKMSAVGCPWGRTTVVKVELKQRQVEVDEAVTLAFVLGVPFVALLLLPDADVEVRVTPTTTMHPTLAWSWMTGDVATRADVVKFGSPEHTAQLRFYDEALPAFLQLAESRVPGLTRVRRSASGALRSAGVADEFGSAIFNTVVELLEETAASAGELAGRLRREKARRKGGAK